MAEEQAAGCTRPIAAAAVNATPKAEEAEQPIVTKKELKMVHVGQKAPDFTAPGYHKGAFVNDVKLSDHLGKWVVLCFYPGDFTFV